MRATDDAHFDHDLRSAHTVLVELSGAWCPPCRALAPSLESLARDRSDVLVLVVDVDESPATAQRFGVRALPTLIVFTDGAPRGQLVGNQPRARIDKLISEATS